MEPAQLDRPPYTDLDGLPPEIASLAVTMLDRMSGHPEIRRVRHTAWEALRPAPGQRLLDAGCGAGDVARALAAAVGPGGEVVALDHSEVTLTTARERDPGGPIRYVAGDVAALDLPSDSFDGVWCERVLQHVADADRAVAELVRVTRPGGRVCLLDTDWTSLAFDGVGTALAATVLDHARGLLPPAADMGRTLRRRLVDRGLTGVTAVPVTCYFPDPESAAVVLPMVNPAVPAEAWPLPAEVREAWFTRIAAAGERGDFLAVLTIWVVCGTVAT
jgi:SAM-dependent methyltransferase